MRCLIKDGEEWREEKPDNLSRWLYRHDGEHAVVIDDDSRPKVYYCATEELLKEYKGQGKDARMFIDLDRQLYEAEEKGQHI